MLDVTGKTFVTIITILLNLMLTLKMKLERPGSFQNLFLAAIDLKISPDGNEFDFQKRSMAHI